VGSESRERTSAAILHSFFRGDEPPRAHDLLQNL
jgi:hypothetical protein